MPDKGAGRVDRRAPSLAWMHYSLLLAGLGTALLGPILPLLARNWQMQDAQSGLLMTAKFCGAFCGGITVSKKLERSLLLGMVMGLVGFGGFAVAPSMLVGCVGLFVGGYGIGLLITATNILAGRRFTEHRGSALSLLNFSFSLGAMLSALLAARLLTHVPLRVLLEGFAGLFAVGGAWMLLERAGRPVSSMNVVSAVGNDIGASALDRSVFFYFTGLLFLYGGLETCLSGWLTTFALRYGGRTLVFGEYATFLLWFSLTVGRVISSLLLLRFPDKAVQRVALGVASLLTAGLAFANNATALAVLSVLLGLALAPFFPATFSLLMAKRPAARQAGLILAVSGLGAAALPWWMGVVSSGTGSLQVGVVLPAAAAIGLLAMSLWPARRQRARG